MKNNKEKTIYSSPEITKIKLDNEISLVLDSAPPVGPGETGKNNTVPEYFNYDPLKSNQV